MIIVRSEMRGFLRLLRIAISDGSGGFLNSRWISDQNLRMTEVFCIFNRFTRPDPTIYFSEIISICRFQIHTLDYSINLLFFVFRYAKVVYGYPKKRGGELMRCARALNDKSSYGPLYFLQRLLHSLDDTDVTTEGMDRKSFRSVELDDWFDIFWKYICLEKWIIPAALNNLAPIKSRVNILANSDPRGWKK